MNKIYTSILALGMALVPYVSSAQSLPASGDISATVQERFESSSHLGVFGFLEKGQAKPTSYQCSQFYLKSLYQKDLTPRQQGEAVQQWVHDCKDHFNDNYLPGDLLVLFDLIGLNTRPSSNPLVSAITFTTQDGRHLSGLLALIRDGKKRPLVIARCGVYCSGVTGSMTNMFISHFFEELGYNVLLLQSMTSHDYSVANRTVSISGFDEAGQMYEVSQNLNIVDSQLSSLTSEIHFVGYSLGGQAALYTSVFASQNATNIPIRSVMALCPVVNLQPQMDFIFSGSIRGRLFAMMNRRLLKALNRLFPVFSDEELSDVSFDDNGLKRIVSVNNLRFYQRYTPNLFFSRLNPFQGVKIETFDDYWRLSRWQDYASQVRVPTMIMTNGDDSVVSVRINANSIDRNASAQLGFVGVDGGNHCGFDLYNGWGVTNGFIKHFVSQYSSQKEHLIRVPLRLADGLASDLRRQVRKIYSYDWTIYNHGENAMLNVYVPTSQGLLCMTNWKKRCLEGDLESFQIRVPLTGLRAAGFPAESDSGSTAARLARYLNANAQVLGPNGQDWRIDPGMPTAVVLPVREAVAE